MESLSWTLSLLTSVEVGAMIMGLEGEEYEVLFVKPD